MATMPVLNSSSPSFGFPEVEATARSRSVVVYVLFFIVFVDHSTADLARVACSIAATCLKNVSAVDRNITTSRYVLIKCEHGVGVPTRCVITEQAQDTNVVRAWTQKTPAWR